MDTLVPYFKTGLENNEFSMWITSGPLEVEYAKESLRMTVPDIDSYLKKKDKYKLFPTVGFMQKRAFLIRRGS